MIRVNGVPFLRPGDGHVNPEILELIPEKRKRSYYELHPERLYTAQAPQAREAPSLWCLAIILDELAKGRTAADGLAGHLEGPPARPCGVAAEG